ncbi:MAG: cellulosome anchoring protein cohesin region [Candidatus Sulfotelmatobacter sp.]|nr:cellulosome anchoring protein cohesin region [Candidatus Sulfotelmatobacter sp.]
MPLWYSRPTRFIDVAWTLSTDPNAASTNVKRGTTSGGPYTLLINVQNPNNAYRDFQVNPGQTYFYVTSEVDNSGSESPNSAEISATVEFP